MHMWHVCFGGTPGARSEDRPLRARPRCWWLAAIPRISKRWKDSSKTWFPAASISARLRGVTIKRAHVESGLETRTYKKLERRGAAEGAIFLRDLSHFRKWTAQKPAGRLYPDFKVHSRRVRRAVEMWPLPDGRLFPLTQNIILGIIRAMTQENSFFVNIPRLQSFQHHNISQRTMLLVQDLYGQKFQGAQEA